jgi:tetratricopeptide (TPR) repeat protein
MGRYAEGQAHLEESLAIAHEMGDKESTALALQPLALASLGQGDRVSAKRWLEEALDLAHELGNKREIAAALNALAQIHRMDGALDLAEPLYEKMVALCRELEDKSTLAIGLLNLAMASIDRESGERARAMLLEVLAICEEVESKLAGQSLLEVSAGLAAFSGQWVLAARLYGAAEAQTARTGLHRDPTDESFLAPLIARARDALGGTAYSTAEDSGRALSYGDAMREAGAWLKRSDAARVP